MRLGLFILMALTLVSCATRKQQRQLFEGGLGYCGNSKLGDFDVVLKKVAGQPRNFVLSIAVVNATNPGGSFVRVALTNEQGVPLEIVPYAKISSNMLLYKGPVNQETLRAYPLVAIYTYKPEGVEGESSDDEAICSIPTADTTTGASATN